MRTANHAHNPFAAFRDLDRVLNGVWSKVEEGVNQATGAGHTAPTPGRFAMDVVESEDQLIVTADLPGFAKDQVHVSVVDRVLTIEAKREPADLSESTVHVRERRHHDIARTLKVPQAYDTTQVQAKLEHGVLTLTLPQREEKKPHTIEVK